MNESGDVFFYAFLEHKEGIVDASNDGGLWGPNSSGHLSLLLREGDPAPDIDGAVFDRFWPRMIQLDDSGRIALNAVLRSGEGGVTSNNDRGIWTRESDGEFRLVVREGDPVPGFPDGTIIVGGPRPIVSTVPSVDGSFLIHTGIEEPLSSVKGALLRAFPDGSLEAALVEGDAVPSIPDATIGDFNLNISDLDEMTTSSGSFVLNAQVLVGIDFDPSSQSDAVLHVDGNNELTVIARRGVEFASGVNGRVEPKMNELGTVVFAARVGAEFTGVLFNWNAADGLQELLVEGDPAPVLPEGSTWVGFQDPHLNDADEVAFLGFSFDPAAEEFNPDGPFGPAEEGGFRRHLGRHEAYGEDSVIYPTVYEVRFNGQGELMFESRLTSPLPPDGEAISLGRPAGELSCVVRNGNIFIIPGAGRQIVRNLHPWGFNDEAQMLVRATFETGRDALMLFEPRN